MTASKYIKNLEADSELNEVISKALADYHSHSDYAAVKTWDAVIGYMTKPKGFDESSGEGYEDNPDYITNRAGEERFQREHGIVPKAVKETATHRIYYIDCINKDQHTTPENETECFISIDKRNGKKNYHCNHSHCDHIYYADYKKFYEMRDGSSGKSTNCTGPPKQFDIKLVPGQVLQAAKLPPIIYPIEGMIPQGYTVASAPFKYGKSWLALEMCLAVSEGADFLGQHTTKGSAVYFALEDCDQFAQERLNIALDNREAPEGFYYIMEGVPTLDDGLIDYLSQLYDKVPNLKLVVIDILAKVEYQPMRGESAYKCDYRTGGALKKWADDHRTSLIAITHTTKMVHPNDIFMNTTGSSGVSGAADALITIAKEKRTDKDAVLAITGRRVREKYFKVHLKDGYMWETDGEVDPDTMQADQARQEQEQRLEEYRSSAIRKAIIKIADANVKDELSSRDIIDKARDNDIHILSTPKEIGGFICKYQNYLFVEDNIKVYIRKRGTASNVYKFVVWDDASDNETPFNTAVV